MAEFSVRVERIAEPVVAHPNADRLSLIKIGGYTCIAAKNEDGSHRYREGDLVVYVPEGAIVPEWLLRREGFWNEDLGKGVLAGSKGDRVKAKRLREIFSQGILISGERMLDDPQDLLEAMWVLDRNGVANMAELGDDVAGLLGITKYEPVIPASMAGEVTYLTGAAVKFDFESIQRVPDLFEPGQEVEATEKLHGTCFQVGYVPGLNNPEMFFDGNVYCCSKGLGAQDRIFKNNERNDKNVYVRALRKMLDEGLGERLREVSAGCSTQWKQRPVRVFAEIFGRGVQDLGYGLDAPTVRAFDVRIGDEFLLPDGTAHVLERLGIERVPVLYRGPYDLAALEAHRDGKDTISGAHIREGIVIRACEPGRHPLYGRRIGKWVSPDYLLRKGGTELA